MRKMILAALVAAVVGLVGAPLAMLAFGAEVQGSKLLYDMQQLQTSTNTAAINTSSATWTNWNALVTVTPPNGCALYDAVVVLDLNKATTGWATQATSQTITVTVARKVDGTNWRVANNLATTALSGTNSTTQSLELQIGRVSEGELVAVYAKVSTVAGLGGTTNIPYVLYYRAPARATVTVAQ